MKKMLLVVLLSLGVAAQTPLLKACENNLAVLGTALAKFAKANGGRYPLRLIDLSPSYLREMPKCPAAKMDTYTRSYIIHQQPERYTVQCGGHHHGAVVPGYSSGKGAFLEK